MDAKNIILQGIAKIMSTPVVLGYTANDYFYNSTEECRSNTPNAVCSANANAAKTLESSQVELSAAKVKYDDIKKLYNRELIFTVNMVFGVGMLVYYIYVNKDVLPALPALPKIGSTPAP